MAGSSRTLLKIVSIILIIFCSLTVLACILGLLGSGAAILSGFVAVGTIGLVWTIVSCFYGVIGFIAGIIGVSGKNLGAGKVLVTIMIIITLVQIVAAFVNNNFAMGDLLDLVLPVLYLIGAR